MITIIISDGGGGNREIFELLLFLVLVHVIAE